MNSLPASGRSTLLATVLVGLAIWITPLQAHSASGNQGTNEIRIVELQGTVEISPAGTQRWFLTQTNQILRPSDKLRTGPHSRVALRWSDQSVVSFGALTLLEIRLPHEPGAANGLNLLGGLLSFFHRDPPGRIRVITRGGTAGVKGTEFVVGIEIVDGTERTRISVIDGTVQFGNDQDSLTLTNSQQAVAELGKAPVRTAGFIANNVLQWCFYYPAVLDLRDLPLTAEEEQVLSDSLAAYRKGDLLKALASYPLERVPGSDAERVYYAALLLSVGRVDQTEASLDALPAGDPSGRVQRLAAALHQLIAAVKFQTAPSTLNPQLSTELLAASYYEQSRAVSEESLSGALNLARQSTTHSPQFGFAWARVAELEFSFGRTGRALEALNKSLDLTPRNAQALALKGFLLAAQNKTREAIEWFNQAIGVDAALGNAWLGRGLCRIRRGESRGGREDLLVAAALEPQRSLLRSYLAKAYGDAGDSQRTSHELDLAKGLDKADPTPWLYSALLKQQQSRINEGIADIEKSEELNQNRSLFRSQFLLDQDRAVRSANLAQLYQHDGMTQVAVREATRAVDSDYGNAPAHLFLANAYDALRDPTRIELRYETPWFHELLLANLLSPVGGGRLSQFVSQQEYSKLLEADGLGVSILNEWRSDSELRSTASLFGTYGRTSFGFDVFYRNDDGDRPNSDDRRVEVYGQFKHEVTPNDIFYFLGKWQDQESGDTFKTYDNRPLSPGLRFEETQAPGLLLAGWNHQWGPGANTLFLGGRLSAEQTLSDPRADQLLLVRDSAGLRPGFVQIVGGFDQFTNPALRNATPPAVSIGPDGETLIYSPALLQSFAPFLGTGDVTNVSHAPFDFYTRRRFEIYSAELQHLQQLERNTLIFGGRLQEGEFETDARLNVIRPNFDGFFSTPAADQHSTTDFERTSLYAYDYWSVAPWLTLIGGGSWDRIKHPDNFRNPPITDEQRREEQVSGKIGFTLTTSRWFRMRGVYAEALGGITFDESVTLEPVQLAGFNQAYRTVLSESIVGSVETPQFTIYGLSVEGTLPSHTWWGASFSVIEQDVNRTVGAFTGYDLSVFVNSPAYFPDSTPQRLAYREQSFEATINQLLGAEVAVGALYRVTKSELRNTFPEIPTTLKPDADTKDEATLRELSFFSNWNSPIGLFGRVEANWYSQHLEDDPSKLPRAGDEFWQLNALLGYRFNRNHAEISVGVLNINDADYRLSPLNPYGDIPRERTAVVRCRFTF